LQNSWLDWVKQGSPARNNPVSQNELLIAERDRKADRKTKADPVSLAQARFQNDDAARNRSDDSRTAPAGQSRPASNELTSGNREGDARNRRNADISTFEPKSGLGGRDGFGRLRDSDQIAAADPRELEVVRSNKQSVYDRGIAPSGNPHQYPFKAAANRPTTESSRAPDTGIAPRGQGVAPSSRNPGAGPSQASHPHRGQPSTPFASSSDQAPRRVILEWSDDGSHEREAPQPNVDASW
jgi:hypothetical protein